MKLLRIIIALGFVVAFAPPAAADFDSALVLDTGYATGPPGWTPWTNLPHLADSLWIYGTVGDVNAPFEDLVPAAPHEFTYVFDGYFCATASGATATANAARNSLNIVSSS